MLAVAAIGAGLPPPRRIAELLERDGLDATVRSLRSLDTPPGAPAPDVVLLAHRQGGAGAARRIRRIRRLLPGAAIVATVPEASGRVARDAFATGVDGLLAEGDCEARLALVVRAACAGFVVLPRSMRHAIDPPALSHREKEIVALAITGRTNAEIARRLCLAESTVKTHLSSAFRRLGVSSRREAAAAVLHRDERLREAVLTTLRGQGRATRREG